MHLSFHLTLPPLQTFLTVGLGSPSVYLHILQNLRIWCLYYFSPFHYGQMFHVYVNVSLNLSKIFFYGGKSTCYLSLVCFPTLYNLFCKQRLMTPHTIYLGTLGLKSQDTCSNMKVSEHGNVKKSVSSVQSLSRVRLFATRWTTACQASLSITNSWSLLKLMSIQSVMSSYDWKT